MQLRNFTHVLYTDFGTLPLTIEGPLNTLEWRVKVDNYNYARELFTDVPPTAQSIAIADQFFCQRTGRKNLRPYKLLTREQYITTIKNEAYDWRFFVD